MKKLTISIFASLCASVLLALPWTCASGSGSELPSGAIRRYGEASPPSWFSGCEGGTFAVAISHDGTRVATGEAQGAVLWNASTGKAIQTYPNRSTVHCLAFSPDGKTLAWGGYGNSFALVDIKSHATLWAPDTGINVGFFAEFSKDGTLLITDGPGSQGHRDDKLLIWDAKTRELLRTISLPGSLWRAVITPDNRTVISASNKGLVDFWDVTTGKKRGSVQVGTSVLDLDMSASGDRVVAIAGWPACYASVIDVKTRKELRRIPHEKPLRAVAISPDGSIVATAGNERGIRLFDAATGKRCGQLPGHDGGVSALTFSADGTKLLSAGFYGSALLWKVPPITHEKKDAR